MGWDGVKSNIIFWVFNFQHGPLIIYISVCALGGEVFDVLQLPKN